MIEEAGQTTLMEERIQRYPNTATPALLSNEPKIMYAMVI